MVTVKAVAEQMGIEHQYIPPHEQSLNEAEKICDRVWAAARVILASTQSSSYYFPYLIDHILYVDMRMATTANRGYKTPYQLIKGHQPNVLPLKPYNCRAWVTVPKSKRVQLQQNDQQIRGEPGRLIGWQSMWSSTYKVMLSGRSGGGARRSDDTPEVGRGGSPIRYHIVCSYSR